MALRVLLISGYDAGSHRQWRQSLVANLGELEWTVIALPGRHFSWRARGNALSLAHLHQQTLNQSFDLLLCTSMVDLSGLVSMVPKLQSIPKLLYFHENQFAYPASGSKHSLVDIQLVNLYSALVADRIAFNSRYNQQSFLLGVDKLMKAMPDLVPKGLSDDIAEKSQVLPVPLADHTATSPIKNEVLQLLWNHRWEYDKGPAGLYLLLKNLVQRKFNFDLHLIGEQFRQQPKEFVAIQAEFSPHIKTFGYVDKEKYEALLGQSDFVLSTALHEFQGLAVMEAVQRGCVPLVPNRLAYPEIFAQEYCYPSLLENPQKEAEGAAEKLIQLQDQLAPDLSQFTWGQLKLGYKEFLRV